ncbi:MAG: TIGR04255 family protein [Actinomycetes bacterium]
MSTGFLDQVPFPDIPVAVLENPPLVLAVCQVRFPLLLGLVSPNRLAPFQNALRSDYPIATQGTQVVFGPGVSGQPAMGEPTGQWTFGSPEGDWSVTIANDFVGLETRAYPNIDELITRMKRVLDAFVDGFGELDPQRVGLRYINEIRLGESVDYRQAIRPELLGPLRLPDFDSVAQAVQEIILRFEGGHGITVRHGLFPIGSTVLSAKASAETGPFYLLDFDAYTDRSASPDPPPDVESVCELLRDYNTGVHRLFRWAVTQRYVASLKEVALAEADETTVFD